MRPDATAQLTEILNQRILIMDGAMGTMIQKHKLTEEDYRGTRFASWNQDVKGNNDLLSITQPEIIQSIHAAYLDAGADIIETNSFSSTAIAQADYAMESLTVELNLASAKLARAAVDAKTAETPNKPRFVAGAIGPTNRTASLSPDVNNPGFRNTDFDQLVTTYREQVDALIDGGVDLILIETVFDTLNAKAAIFAAEDAFEARGQRLPIMISGTITDMSGRNLSGQTTEAFAISVAHARPLAIGLNCAFGAELMRPYMADLARIAPTFTSAYPNAGLPNAFGEYDEPPEKTGELLAEWAESGLINIVGGCCGTTPDHIRAIARAVEGKSPRQIPNLSKTLRLSGLEAFGALA